MRLYFGGWAGVEGTDAGLIPPGATSRTAASFAGAGARTEKSMNTNSTPVSIARPTAAADSHQRG